MTKEELYTKMDIGENDIQKGESLFKSLSAELRKKFLSDIYAEYQPDGFFKSIYYIYGEFPKYRKVVLINFAIEGSIEEKQRLANGLSNPYDNQKIEDLFHLTYDWIKTTEDPKIKQSLSRGLLFYLDKNEVKEYLKANINDNLEFIKGMFSWLYIQPDWFRETFKEQEIEIWNEIQGKWSENLNDEFKVREINKSLGLDINKTEIWLHEIENPWNFSDKEIKRLKKEGISINIDGYIGEFAMGSPAITGLILNSKKINKSIGGPFVTDNENKFLCCTTFVREEGFKLVVIDLKSNEIIELHTSKSTYTPYKYENGEFVVITGNNKINLLNDTIRFKLNEIKLPTTTYKNNGGNSANTKLNNTNKLWSKLKNLWS
jgi:hypothetical protein